MDQIIKYKQNLFYIYVDLQNLGFFVSNPETGYSMWNIPLGLGKFFTSQKVSAYSYTAAMWETGRITKEPIERKVQCFGTGCMQATMFLIITNECLHMSKDDRTTVLMPNRRNMQSVKFPVMVPSPYQSVVWQKIWVPSNKISPDPKFSIYMHLAG